MDYERMPVPVRHARLINLLNDVRNEVNFSLPPESKESINTLLDEAYSIVRTLQQAGGQPSTEMPDMVVD